MGWSAFRKGSRSRAATAAFLSSVFPGLGQLYNGAKAKAAAMAALALLFLGVATRALEQLVALAAGHAGVGGLIALQGHDGPERLLLALSQPGVQREVRHVLLPAVLALCGLVCWSMLDAYRQARR
jgi:TM2 domain-containing membrane protein YozV